MIKLIKPHWWKIVNLYNKEVPSTSFIKIVNEDIECDIYNILCWIFSPLEWFMKKDDFYSVLKNMRLDNWIIWSIPIVIDVSEKEKFELENKNVEYILLRNHQWEDIAVLRNEEIFEYNKDELSKSIFGTSSIDHPWVKQVGEMWSYLIGWELIWINHNSLGAHEYFWKYYQTPVELREFFVNKWWSQIVAFQTRNPPHRSHEYLQKCALENCDWLYINPVIWKKKKWDFNDEFILWAYEILFDNHYNKEKAHLWILPLTMRYAWPKEAILHAIIRQNFWCSHIIIWRDHAWVWDFYWSYDAQDIFDTLNKNDLEIQILKYEHAGHCNKCWTITSNKSCPHWFEDKILLSWTKVRDKIMNKQRPPEEFMRKEVSDFLCSWINQFVE